MDLEQRVATAVGKWTGWDMAQAEIATYDDSGKHYLFGTFGLNDGCSNDLFIQFNQLFCSEIINDSVCIAVAVYALRFRVCSGWFPFLIHDDALAPLIPTSENYLHYRNFVSSEAQQSYFDTHPECINYSWQKVRSVGVPYSVVSNKRALIYRNRDQVILREWSWEEVKETFIRGERT
jgi:hypothetical protein